MGVAIVTQWKQIRIVPRRTWVRSLASLSEFRILRCHELWCRLQTRLGFHVAVAVAVVYAGSCSSNSTSSLGTSKCRGCSLKKKKKKKINIYEILYEGVDNIKNQRLFSG